MDQMDEKTTRKDFLGKALGLGAAALTLGSAVSCGRHKADTPAVSDGANGDSDYQPTSCDDLTGVDQSELDKRETYGYVEETPYPDNRCDNCSLYIPPEEEDGCGGCVLFQGPVFDDAYCDYWAPLNA